MSRRSTTVSALVLAAAAAATLVAVVSASRAKDATPEPEGAAAPPPAAATAPIAAATAATGPSADSPFENVQVLTHVKTKQEMRTIMKAQAAALGVKCSYCHVQGDPASDEKKKKLAAREMLKMVEEINASWFADEPEQAVTCWTCHRGHDEPEHVVPQSAFDALEAMSGAPSGPSAPTGASGP